MGKKTAVDRLKDAIAGILEEYADDVGISVDNIVNAMGKKGAQALRAKSKETFPKGTGEYAKGWKYEFHQTRRYSKTTLYNDHPGLPHLLENGHVTRNGTGRDYGSVPGHTHIKAIADELLETFEREVTAKL